MNQLLVYTSVSSPRVEYIFSTLLQALGIREINFTTDKDIYIHTLQARINYSADFIQENELWLCPVSLLFEKEIKTQEITCFEFGGTQAFFKTLIGNYPFDIFAASFYLISRYEEYLPHTKDEYGRFAHDNSIACKTHFLDTPVVNLWLQHFDVVLKQKFPQLILQPSPFTFLPTYDIDIAYSYLHKGVIRNMGGFIKSMWSSDWALVEERMNVLFGKQQDPFDCYNWLDKLHDIYHLSPIYFFLVAQKNKDYDKNILCKKHAMKNLIEQHSKQYAIGIHPSWQSNSKVNLLTSEITSLENITGNSIAKSRQHYIKLELPVTYRGLIQAGITEDYSMGYGSINGFRASYCLPFLWYDLQKEQTTNLTVFPFCYMDANSFYEQHLSADEALDEMMYFYNTTRKVNGLFITIWHNHFLGTDKLFKGWSNIYETFIKKIDADSREISSCISALALLFHHILSSV